MQVITKTSFAEQTINKSHFIAMAVQCIDELAIGVALRAFAAQHTNAHHLAYGFRLKTPTGIVPRFSDAGEPSGTAGMPILKLIEGRDLINVCVAVIRYYGGVNLGTGGLARAYGDTAKIALDAAMLAPFVEMTQIKLVLDYSRFDELTHDLAKVNGTVIDKKFEHQVTVFARLPLENSVNFQAKFNTYHG